MTLSYKARVLAYAANRAKVHPDYLGWVLARYRELEKISEHNLVDILGTTSRDLPRLGLCLRPREDHFAEDIEQISAKFNVDAAALAKIVRLVESVEVMAATDTRAVSTESGLLMAARTRKKKRTYQGKKGHADDRSNS